MNHPAPAPAVLVVGMSIREVDRRDELNRGAAACGAEVAYLQLGDPSLSSQLSRLADHGCERIVLVGVSLGVLAPAHSWLRRIAAHWWRQRAGHRPVVDVATRLIGSADAEAVARATEHVKPVDGSEPGLTSPAWQDVPVYRRQVMVCRGPRCTAMGGEDALRSLVMTMMKHDMSDDDALLVHTGCQFPCNRAPVLSVQPDDVWYGEVDAQVAEQIVERHLLGDEPVARHVLPRTRP